VCRYVAVAIASPLALLYFGYYELGYLSLSGAVVPLLAIRRGSDFRVTGSTLSAGLFQGFHTALHGFGLLGLGGGVLSLRNDLGLLAEEYDPVAKRQVGNFPQAFSHLALINAVIHLIREDERGGAAIVAPSGLDSSATAAVAVDSDKPSTAGP